ncbi:MAG: V-type ATP synthase subunit E [Oscillospiraceae bacterium]
MQENIDEEKNVEFSLKVINAAQKKAKKIVGEAKNYRSTELKNAEKLYTEESYEKRKRELESAQQCSISAARLALRKELLVYRSNLVDALFNKIIKNLKDFATGKDYLDFLIKDAKKHMQEGEAVEVLLSAGDMHLENDLKKALGCNIALDESIKIGGVKVNNGKVIFDETFDNRLREEKTEFLSYCNLEV